MAEKRRDRGCPCFGADELAERLLIRLASTIGENRVKTMACAGPGVMARSGPTWRRLLLVLMLPDRPVEWGAAAVVAKAEPVGRVPEWR